MKRCRNTRVASPESVPIHLKTVTEVRIKETLQLFHSFFQIMRILNGSEDATLDWSAMGFKAETLIKMITDNFMKTPTVDGELSEFFNIENMLAMLQSLVMNPNM